MEVCSYLHVHEVVIAQIQVGLSKTNLHWNNGTLLKAGALDPISTLNSSLLMKNMLDWRRGSTAESSNAQNSRQLDEHLETKSAIQLRN